MEFKRNSKNRKKLRRKACNYSNQGNEEDHYQPSPQKKVKREYQEETFDDYNEVDDNLQKLISYHETIERELKRLPQNEDKTILAENALRESNGFEVQLCSRSTTSHFIEFLLSICEDITVLQQFMTSFSLEKIQAFTSPSASHITELLIKIALQNIEKHSRPSDDDKNNKREFFISWITELGVFIEENFVSCVEDPYACHVTSTVIRALGGDISESTDFSSKRAVSHKKEIYQKFSGGSDTEQRKSIVLESIPKGFIETLEKIVQAFQNVEDDSLTGYVTKNSSAALIQALVCPSSKLKPKDSKKIIEKMAEKLFCVKNEGIPFAFTHKTSSYVVETMFQSADEEMRQKMWEEYFQECLESLVSHPVGNFVVQRLFDVVERKNLLVLMFNSIETHFKRILQCRYYGLFNAVAGACQRLSTKESQFLKSLMSCLECLDPDVRQCQLAPLTLGFQVYGQPSGPWCLQGSLLLQTMLKFQKPILVVNSVLQLKPEQLKNLACDKQGCHVLNAFFGSPSVGHQSREKLLQRFQPTIVETACHRGGSLTLCRIWILLNIKQKEILVGMLVKAEARLKATEGGFSLYKKFGLFYYGKKRDQWVHIQQNFERSIKKNVNT